MPTTIDTLSIDSISSTAATCSRVGVATWIGEPACAVRRVASIMSLCLSFIYEAF
jgi:hypothetical protein